jgi:hypothetical protein
MYHKGILYDCICYNQSVCVSSTFLSLNLFGYPAQWCAITNLFVRVCLTFIVIHFLKIYARYCIYEIQKKKITVLTNCEFLFECYTFTKLSLI